MLVWQNYLTDLGRAYPLFPLSITQVTNVDTNINPVDLLPTAITAEVRRVRNSCPVPGLTPRQLLLYTSDRAQFRLTFPVPFSQTISDYLVASVQVVAFEFIGEKIRYGRLQKMIDNV